VSPPADQIERRLGFEAGDFGAPDVAVWPENWPAVATFNALQTQWIIAPSGRLLGLRYESLPVVWQALGIRRRHQRRLFHDLRVMETAALAALADLADHPAGAA
jgi:hypothetical protein